MAEKLEKMTTTTTGEKRETDFSKHSLSPIHRGDTAHRTETHRNRDGSQSEMPVTLLLFGSTKVTQKNCSKLNGEHSERIRWNST